MKKNENHVNPNLEKRYILGIKDTCENTSVGGKAFNISKLARAKFPVPGGFSITTKAYDYFIEYNNISEEVSSDTIRNGLMPPALAEMVLKAYTQHVDHLCIVRSSSPAEDLKSASFAGQYTSVLNVTGASLLDAVKECWASLWAEPAVEYRKKMGITENVKMAVLVQEMVPARASGVLFTEDPMVIEGVWGLGDILVGGKVIPDQFHVDKRGLQITKRTISHKTIMSTVNPEGGTLIQDVPDHLRDTPVLDDNDIQALCILGKKVEALFGCPQDIEWALQDNNLILLQARPITVQQEYEPDMWSRANAADTMPGYATYLSRIPENKPDDIGLGLTPLLECFGIKEDPQTLKFREYIYGYMYLNMTTIGNVLGQIPGLSKDVLYQSLGHTTEEEAPKPSLGLSTIIKLLPGTLKVMQFFLQLPKRAHKVIPYSQELITYIRRKNLQELSENQLEDLIWDMYERNSQVLQVHSVTALAVFALFGLVQKITARIGEEGTENVLTIGLDGMSSSQLGVEMWKLTEYASHSEKVSKLILSGRKTVLEELEKFPEGLNFLEELRKFSEQYGDRCSQELELSVPRWEEDPLFVLSMVRTYLKSPVDPVNTMEELKRTRLEATDRILKKLSTNPLKLVFKLVLGKTQQYIVVRENLKTTWVRGISAMRVVYLAIAEKLVNRKILERKEDIFYLKMTEVSRIIEGILQKEDIIHVIEERRKEKRECANIEVPEVVVGSPPPIEELKCIVEPKDTLEGTGCSRGVVTGRARIIQDPRETSDFEQGDILIAHTTDPGWSPLFVTAGGLVMELGGTLSHGVIIAREYGIPAVVGVKNATKLIKNGHKITVDGNKGLVYVR